MFTAFAAAAAHQAPVIYQGQVVQITRGHLAGFYGHVTATAGRKVTVSVRIGTAARQVTVAARHVA